MGAASPFRRLPAPALLAGAAAFALYVFTLAPDLLWSDSAKLALLVAERDALGFGHGRHPLHTLAGMAFALLPHDLPYTQNLLSAAAGALAVGLVAAAAARVASPPAALLAALALALSHTFWLYSVINESYSLLWCLLALALLLALGEGSRPSRRGALGLGVAAGLALSAHGLAALALPGLALLARGPAGGDRAARAAVAAGGLAAGAALVWLPALAPATEGAREGLGLARSSLEHAQLYLRPGKLARELACFPAYLAYQLPGVGLVALGLGARSLARRDRAVLVALAAASLPIVVFASGYLRQRQFAMLGASYLLLAPLVACGLDRLLARGRPLALALALLAAPPLVYLAASRSAARHGFPFPVRELPFRDEARYFLWPPKRGERSARLYVEAARRHLPPGATVIADFNPGEPLRYAIEVEKSLEARLLEVVDDLVLAGGDPGPRLLEILHRELAAAGPGVYLADSYDAYYRVSYLRERFALEEVGPFLRVSRDTSRDGASGNRDAR